MQSFRTYIAPTITSLVIFSMLVLAPMSFTMESPVASLQTAYAQTTPQTTTQNSASPNTTSSAINSVDCSLSWSPTTWSSFFSPTCWGRVIATVIGTMLIWLASYILYWSGLLFDWVMTDTVLQFGNLVNSGVITAINTAWSAFRDISNIIIIGMFTFIAIATILGLNEYGYKKLLARVLIVAVLINFSLLFTKLIIDVSNFTAVQFLNAAAQSTNCQQCSQLDQTSLATGSQGSTQPTGIAGAFLSYAGAQSFGDTFSALNSIAQDPNNGGPYALLYGFIVSILEVGAAVVLLYGSFLLISRALLMVFLMITSSVAFASYLVPSSWTSNYGWDAWWSSLLKNAVFAPLLAVLLWVTLTIAQAFQMSENASGQKMSLGALLPQNGGPPSSLGIEALFGYIFVIGLLFISLKVSSSFATQIGGFNWASAIASTPLALADRYVGAPLMQYRFGRRNMQKSDEASAQAKKATDAGNHLEAQTWLRRKENYDARAKRSYDVFNTQLGQRIGSALGVPKGLLKTNKSNYADSASGRTKAAVEKVAGLATISDEQKEEVRNAASRQIQENRQQSRTQLEQQRKGQKENLEAIKAGVDQQVRAVEDQKQTLQKQVEVQEKTQKDIENRYGGEMKTIAEELGKHAPGTNEHNTQLTRLNEAKLARDSEMAKQEDKIRTVKQQIEAPVADLDKKIRELRDPIQRDLATFDRETNKMLRDLDNSFDKEVDNAVTIAQNARRDMATEVGAKLAQPKWEQMLGIPADSATSAAVSRGLRSRLGAVEQLRRAVNETAPTPTPPPSAPSAGTTT